MRTVPNQTVHIVHYWGGSPKTPNSKWVRFLRLVQACAARGWRQSLVWSDMPADEGLWRPFVEIGCEIRLLSRARGNFDWGCIWRTYKLLRRVRCTILHCHNVHTSPLVAGAIAGVPVRIWSKLSMSSYYEQGVKPPGLHRFQLSTRLSGALAHRVLAISEAVADELLSLGVLSGKVLVRPQGVDLGPLRTARAVGLRADIGLPGDAPVILSVGHAVPVKGWDILVEAFAKAAGLVGDARLVFVGSVDEADEADTFLKLESMVRARGLVGRVAFTGRRNDIPRLLAAADVFVLPSRSEGRPLALLEAMAAGKACIAARVGGVGEVIRDGHDGLLFDRGDVASLVADLVRLLGDDSLRRRLGQRAAESSRAFDVEVTTRKMVELYEELSDRYGRNTVMRNCGNRCP